MTATQTAGGFAALDGLPKPFVNAMRTLFDIMDDQRTGYVKFSGWYCNFFHSPILPLTPSVLFLFSSLSSTYLVTHSLVIYVFSPLSPPTVPLSFLFYYLNRNNEFQNG